MESKMTRREKICLILILAAALVLRLGAVNFGLPYHESFGDELVHTAAGFKMLAEKTLRADFDFYYLPPLLAYLLAPIFALVGLFGILIGKFQGLADYQHFVLLYRENFLSAGRVISAIFGTAGIYFLFLLAKRIFNKKVAFLSSLLLTFDFLHLHESQIGHIWAPLVFFTVLVFYFLLRLYERPEKKWYVWTALAIGLGYGMGQIPIVYYLLFLAVHLLASGQGEGFKKKLFQKDFVLATLIVFLIFVLFTYLNTYSFLKHFYDVVQTLAKAVGLKTLALPEVPKAAGFSFSYNWELIAKTVFYNNPFLVIAAFLGFFVLLKKFRLSNPKNIFLVIFPPAYLIFFSLVFYLFLYRYALPVWPSLIISASFFIFWLRGKTPGKYQRLIFGLLVILMLGYSAVVSGLYTFKLQRGYTLSQGIEWVYKNIPSGSRLVSTTYFTPNKESLELLRVDNKLKWLDTRKSYLLTLEEEKYPRPNYFVINPNFTDLASLDEKERWADYVFISFYSEAHRKEQEGFFEFFKGERQPVAAFYPAGEKEEVRELINYDPHFLLPTLFKVKYIGPNVEIYKLNR